MKHLAMIACTLLWACGPRAAPHANGDAAFETQFLGSWRWSEGGSTFDLDHVATFEPGGRLSLRRRGHRRGTPVDEQLVGSFTLNDGTVTFEWAERDGARRRYAYTLAILQGGQLSPFYGDRARAPRRLWTHRGYLRRADGRYRHTRLMAWTDPAGEPQFHQAIRVELALGRTLGADTRQQPCQLALRIAVESTSSATAEERFDVDCTVGPSEHPPLQRVELAVDWPRHVESLDLQARHTSRVVSLFRDALRPPLFLDPVVPALLFESPGPSTGYASEP